MQIVTTLCDLCYDEENDTRVESVGTFHLEINGRATEIDLCSKHEATLEEALTPFYMSGRRPDHIAIRQTKSLKPSKQTSGAFACDFSGCARSFATHQGMAMHRTRSHGTHGMQNYVDPDPDRVIEGETSVDRKRRRDRERYALHGKSGR